MRTRRLHARLAYVKRADNRASVAFAAASTFPRTPRPPRVAYAEASCRPRLRGKKRLEVGLRIACLAWLGSLAHMMRTRLLHARLCARLGKAFGARRRFLARAWEKPSARAHTLRQKQRESFRAG